MHYTIYKRTFIAECWDKGDPARAMYNRDAATSGYYDALYGQSK